MHEIVIKILFGIAKCAVLRVGKYSWQVTRGLFKRIKRILRRSTVEEDFKLHEKAGNLLVKLRYAGITDDEYIQFVKRIAKIAKRRP
jgi:hypothetical protein